LAAFGDGSAGATGKAIVASKPLPSLFVRISLPLRKAMDPADRIEVRWPADRDMLAPTSLSASLAASHRVDMFGS